MTEEDLKTIQYHVGPIKEKDMRFVECYPGKKLSVFLPVVGPCQYSISPDHSHPSYLFLYAYDDLCKVQIQGKIMRSEKGKLSVISPGIIHHEIVDDSFSRYALMMIEPAFFEEILGLYNLKCETPFKAENFPAPPQLPLLIREFINEVELKHPGHSNLLEAVSLRICHGLIRSIYEIGDSTRKFSNRLDIEEVIQYMNCHYPDEISMDDLAAIMHRSPSAFRRIFKEETGVSPGEFLIQIRLERARKLLLATEQSVSDIAFACGFNSSSHFAVTFSKKFKINPREFKKYHLAKKGLS